MGTATWQPGTSLEPLGPREVDARLAGRRVRVLEGTFAGCEGRSDGAVRAKDGALMVEIRVSRVIDNPTCALLDVGRGSCILVPAALTEIGGR